MKLDTRSWDSFLSFFSGGKGAVGILIVVLLGAILLGLGSFGGSEVEQISEAERLSALCEKMEGVGKCEVYISYEPASYGSSSERVSGVAVVCEGAGSAAVRAQLVSLVVSLYGIGSNRISITKMC